MLKEQTMKKGGDEAGHKVLILGNKCYRCSHEWVPERFDVPPKVCPKCKNPYWDRPKQDGVNNSERRKIEIK